MLTFTSKSRIVALVLLATACAAGAPAGELALVRDGKPMARIVVDQGASPTAKFAAKELTTYIKKSTGVELPTVGKLTDDGLVEIVVGPGKIAASLGVDTKGLTRDAFKIKAVGKRIVILGRDDPRIPPLKPNYVRPTYAEHATVFGVYEFLERYLGVRWYLPVDLGEVVPKTQTLSVPVMDITEAPEKTGRCAHIRYGADDRDDPMPTKVRGRYRGGYLPGFTGKEREEFLWRRTRHGLRMRYQTTMTTGNHTMWALISPKRFGKTHPEYFALSRGGSRGANVEDPAHSHHCFSNPGAVEEIIRLAKAAFRGKTARKAGLRSWSGIVRETAKGKAFHILQDDGYRPCLCKSCEAFRKRSGLTGRPAEAELVWSLVAKVANAVKKEFPNCVISAAAYGPMGQPPKAKLPRNILISGLATTGPYEEFMPVARKSGQDRIKKWLEVVGPENIAGFYHYALKGGWENGHYKSTPAICGSLPRTYAAAYKRYAKVGQGTYLYLMSHRFAYDHLSQYVFYKYHWNSDRDIDALLNEYYTLFYGPAAKPMGRFWEDVEVRFRRVFSHVVNTSLGPQSRMVPEEVLWGEIYSPDVMKKWQALFADAKRLTVGSDPIYAKRVAYMKRNVLDSVVVGPEPYKELVAVLKKEKAGLIKGVPMKVVNGSFERPVSSDRKKIRKTWVIYYNGGKTAKSFRDDTTAAEGKYSGCVKGSGRMVGFMRVFRFIGGGVYRFRFKYRMTQARGTAKFRVNKSWLVKSGKREAWIVEKTLPLAETWTEYQTPILITNRHQRGKRSDPLVTLVAINQDENEAVWFDDFRIEKLFEPKP